MRGIMVRGMWMEWTVWMQGELVSPRSGLDHTQLGRAGLAWGWIDKAWCWIVVWGCRCNGGPRQWCSMVACLRSAWHHFWQNVCVSVSLEVVPAFGGIHSRVRTRHAETLKRQTWRKIWPTLPTEGREASLLSQYTLRQFKQFMPNLHTQHVQFCLQDIICIKYLNGMHFYGKKNTSKCTFPKSCVLLKGELQVKYPSHSMCRIITWELDFHNNMLIYALQWLLESFLSLCFCFEICKNCDVDRGGCSTDRHLTTP